MKQQIITTEHAQYIQREWTGENTSGWQPFGDAVLILPDKASTKMGAHGLIELPDNVVERNALAAETGMIVALGDGAFVTRSNGLAWEGSKPKPGDKVIFGRYSGRNFKGHDGETYRVMSDDCIAAVEIGVPADISEALENSGVTTASVPAVPRKSKKGAKRGS